MWDINKGHLLFSPRFKEWVIFKGSGLNHFTNWNAYDVKYAFETIVFLTWDLLETSQIHIFLLCTFKYPNVSSQYAHHIVLYKTLLGVDISLPLDTWLIIFFMAIILLSSIHHLPFQVGHVMQSMLMAAAIPRNYLLMSTYNITAGKVKRFASIKPTTSKEDFLKNLSRPGSIAYVAFACTFAAIGIFGA